MNCLCALINAPGKHGAKYRRLRARLETLHVDSARRIEKFLRRKITRKLKVSRRPLSRIRTTIRRSASLYSSIKRLRWSNSLAFHLRKPDSFPGDAATFACSNFCLPPSRCQVGTSTIEGMRSLFCNLQRAQAVARPAMKQIVTPGCQLPRGDPIEIFFFRAVIIGPIKKGNEPVPDASAENGSASWEFRSAGCHKQLLYPGIHRDTRRAGFQMHLCRGRNPRCGRKSNRSGSSVNYELRPAQNAVAQERLRFHPASG